MTPDSVSRAPRLLLAALLPFAFAAVLAPLPAAATGKPDAIEAQQRATLRVEIQRALAARGIAKTGVDRVLANLDRLDMAALRDLAGFAGEAPTGAGRLIEGSAGGVRDRAGELTGRSGIGSGGGSASQRGIDRAMTPGVRDTRGHTSSCQACPKAPAEEAPAEGSKQRNGAEMVRAEQPATAGKTKTVNAGNGDVIVIHPDGSASIQRPNGKKEYINSDQRLVDESGKAKEPLPDDQGASGGFTAADVQRVAALINRHRQPAGTDDTGTGGPVDAGRANPTGSRGLYTDAQLGAGYVSRADLEEIVRVAFEKLRGPQGR